MKKFLFIPLFFIFGCMNAQKIDAVYNYADGSNNVFMITSDSLEYKPMTPIRSSSGTYSGGEAKKVSITKDEFEKIESLFNQAIENKSMHIEKRVMMSGMLTVKNGEDSQTFIFGARSKSKADIEKALRNIINK